MGDTTSGVKERSAAADKAAIAGALAVLFKTGDVVEVRIPDHPRTNLTTAGYFDDFEKLAAAALTYSGDCHGVYVTLNEINPALLARYCNRMAQYAKALTVDADMRRRRWLLL